MTRTRREAALSSGNVNRPREGAISEALRNNSSKGWLTVVGKMFQPQRYAPSRQTELQDLGTLVGA